MINGTSYLYFMKVYWATIIVGIRASGSWLTLSELLEFGTRTVDVISYLPVCAYGNQNHEHGDYVGSYFPQVLLINVLLSSHHHF